MGIRGCVLDNNMTNARLEFNPHIVITGESISKSLNISIEDANNLLSSEHAKNLIFEELKITTMQSLDNSVRKLAKYRWPNIELRRDITVRVDGVQNKLVGTL